MDIGRRLGPGSGHMGEEGCWECRRAARLPDSESGVDVEAGIRKGLPRAKKEASLRLGDDALCSRRTRQCCKAPENDAAAVAADAGMVSRLGRQHRESSARDGIAAVGCRHRMSPWPGPSRGKSVGRSRQKGIRFSRATWKGSEMHAGCEIEVSANG